MRVSLAGFADMQSHGWLGDTPTLANPLTSVPSNLTPAEGVVAAAIGWGTGPMWSLTPAQIAQLDAAVGRLTAGGVNPASNAWPNQAQAAFNGQPIPVPPSYAGTNAAEASAGVANAAAIAATHNANVAFVTHLYNTLLGRAPEAGALDGGYVTALDMGTVTDAQVTAAFMSSPEYLADQASIAGPANNATNAPHMQTSIDCQSGYSVDAGGVCTKYSDSTLLNGLNSITYTGASDIPTEQIMRIDPQILATYGNSPNNVLPGSVLAYILGLGGTAPVGTNITGDNGANYQMSSGGLWVLLAAPLNCPTGFTWLSQPGSPGGGQCTAVAANNTSGTSAGAGYVPSTDDLYVYASAGIAAPYTLQEIEFAQLVESLAGSPVTASLTAAVIASAWHAYQSSGYNLTAAQTAIQSGMGVAPSSTAGMSTTTMLLLGVGAAGLFLMAGHK